MGIVSRKGFIGNMSHPDEASLVEGIQIMYYGMLPLPTLGSDTFVNCSVLFRQSLY